MTREADDSGARIPLRSAGVDEWQSMSSVERELHVEFPSVPIEQVTILVTCLWAHFDGAPVREFVPLMVRRQAKEELRDHLGPRAERAPSEPPARAHPRVAPLRPEGSTP